jgi:hypothetical protein
MKLPAWGVAVAVVAVLGLGVGGTLLLTDRSLPANERLPPGCAPADRTRPGCRPIVERVSSNTIALAAVIASPLASLFVALVAVGAARKRQDVQLNAEGDRLDRQLAAEGDRLDRQLAHDRELRDRDHVRNLLDDAAAAMETFLDALRVIGSEQPPHDEALKHRQELSRALGGVHATLRRLTIRFPFDHPIIETYMQAFEPFHDVVSELGAPPPVQPKLLKALEAAFDASAEGFAHFTDAAQEVAAAVPDPP